MSKEIILIGGGGHCKSCIDVIESDGRFTIAGIVDQKVGSESLCGYRYIGVDSDLNKLKLEYDFALVTVGQINTSVIRRKLFDQLKSIGFKLPVIVSTRAYISKYATLGEGTIVMHDALINAGVLVGRNCIINTKALIEHDVNVGDHCHVSTGAIINGSATIGEGTFIGSNSIVCECSKTGVNDFVRASSLFKGY